VTLDDVRGEDRRASAAQERVRRAFGFLPPDRIPRFDSFWDYPAEWRELLGEPEELSDIEIWAPSEGAFCSRERLVKEVAGGRVRVDAWGATTWERAGAYFAETLDVAIPAGTDPDSVQFDPPGLDARFGESRDARAASRFVFGKTGGPYLRTTFVRGEAQFLLDIASDPHLARTLADKMADHLAAVGVETICRWNLQDTGMSIWDDMAGNNAPMFSPAQFERIFLPGYRRMIKAYRDAGAPHVFLHSDGNILPMLEMLVDAGIDGLNPLERRAGMDPVLLRARFPRLVLIGGMDNTDTLINGPVQKIEAEARALIDLGRDGGLIIGTHSVSPEISLENFAAYDRCCRTYGDFAR
jgi:hypothetical protein